MSEFMKINLDYIYFVYGLGFLLLSSVCFVLFKTEKGKHAWMWLALFGLFHGVNEWLDLCSLTIVDKDLFKLIRVLVLFVSFLFLFEYGRRNTKLLYNKGPGIWVILPLLALIYVCYQSYGLLGFNIASRYFLGVCGGIWSAFVLFGEASSGAAWRKKLFITAGILLFIYAFTQTAVPKASFYPVIWFNQDIFFAVTGLPIQLVRAILAMFLAFVFWSYWDYGLFSAYPSYLSRRGRLTSLVLATIIFISIIAGWLITDWFGRRADFQSRSDILARTKTAAAAIDPRRINNLAGTMLDIDTQDYRRIKEQLGLIDRSNPDIRFVYLLTLKDNKIIFLVDAEPESSRDYSPPGQIYQEASRALKYVFYSNQPSTFGPYVDRWGRWISGFAPVNDLETGKVIAVLGFDIDSTHWEHDVFIQRFVGIVITLCFLLVLIGLFIIFELSKSSAVVLSASEMRFKATVFGIGDGVIATDSKGRIALVNPVAEKLTGWFQKEAICRKLNEVFRIINEKTRQPCENPVDKVLATGKIVGLANHTLLIAKDGTEKVLADSAAPIHDPFGNIIGVVLVFRDVTEEKRKEDQLRRLAAIVDSSDDAIVGKTLDGTIISWNLGAEKVYGYKADEIIGKPIFLLVPLELKHEIKNILFRIRNGERVEHFETIRLRKDGGRINVSLALSPVHNEDGEVTGVSTIARDITETKIAQEKIAQAEREWERTFNSITDMVFIQDKDSRILKANSAFLKTMGMRTEDVVGKYCYEVVHKTKEPWPNCPFEKTKKDNAAHSEEVNDPSIGVPLLITTSPIFNEEGELVGDVHIAKDISEIKNTEAKLREALVIKSNFTSMVSHELRTPLTAIKEGISIVADGSAGGINAEQKDFLVLAKRNVDRLARLINDVLDIQKLESGKMIFNIEGNDINSVVKDVREIMLPVCNKKGLGLVVNINHSMPTVNFDRDKITQALTNLINNAVRFTEKGSITITTELQDNMVLVSVKDDGVGIKEEDMPRLFQRFSQLDTGPGRKTGGSGLGLAISKEIIEKHGGKIWAESKYGAGAIFHFTLPIKK